MARIAAVQHGVVHRDQLIAAGLSRHAIAHRLNAGRLVERHPSVYLVGRPSVEPLGPETAAVLLFAGHGVLSHASAAALWGLVDPPTTVTITLVDHHRGSRPGIHVHRVASLDPADLRCHRGLPVTAPARTLIDLAATLADIERAVAEARVQRLIRPGDLEAAVARAPHRKGTAAISALVNSEHDPAFTRRALERRFLAVIREAQLPRPRVNAQLLGFEVDFLWPEQRLVVETDGRRFHGHARAFEADRRRDQILLAAGFRVMRITWRQLRDEPLAVVARLAQALTAAAA